jgi:hypothetical protein
MPGLRTIGVFVALAAVLAPVAAGAGDRPARAGASRLVTVTFTGKGGGRYLDVTRWLHDDTRECYARRTADETVFVSWRLTWTARVTQHGKTVSLEPGRAAAPVVSGRVSGSSVRDSCDAAEEEEPGWAGSDRCASVLPLKSAGRFTTRTTRSGAELYLRGPVYGGPAHPCELEIRNDQLEAHVPLDSTALAALAAGRKLSMPVGTAHPRPGDDFLPTRDCSPFPHIYDGVVYLYDCNDTLIWRGAMTIAPS